MKVGDKVTLRRFPSWGVCKITHIGTGVENITYQVRRCDSLGITRLILRGCAQIIPLKETK